MRQFFTSFLRRHWLTLLLLSIAFGGGLYAGRTKAPTVAPIHRHATHSAPKKKTIWTCSMHPQIRMPKKGKCPICFMDLIPLADDDAKQQSARRITLSKTSATLAQVRTSLVERRPVVMDVDMLGRVAYDETRVKSITAWVPGRLERLFVDYTGVKVRKGDHLVRIYSPKLLSSQQELLQAYKGYQLARKQKRGALAQSMAQQALRSAQRKLELLGLKGWQLQRILTRKKPSVRTNIYAPMGGIVIQKRATEGMYVKTGSVIYTIADLSQVWIRFDAYERDLPWLHIGQEVSFQTQATPGQTFEGKIVYIDPMLDPKTRTVGVRVNAKNPKGLLKPGMFVRGHVHVSLDQHGGARQTKREGKWVCPMHPEVISKTRTRCRICGMSLERIKSPKDTSNKDPLVIPASAPLLTGKRAIVYVALPNTKRPTYEGREITLGPRAGAYYTVLKGLKEGERVVQHGAFQLDSELQLRGKHSMMNPPPKKRHTHTPPKRIKLPKQALKRLKPLYTAYFTLQRALADDKPKRAHKAYKQLGAFLRRPLTLHARTQKTWQKLRVGLYDAFKKGNTHTTLAPQRAAFEDISKQVIQLEQRFGHAGKKEHFLAYCPMAFNNRGAYWLQDQKGLLNPYFGHSMLRCGEIKRTFVGRAREPVDPPVTFLKRLTPIYGAYLRLQDHLFKDKWEESRRDVTAIKKALKPSIYRRLPKRLRKRWRTLKRSLTQHTKRAGKSKDIEALRVHFEDLSKDMLQLAYIFGHVYTKPLYEAYCPMAFNNRGAAWLQDQDKRVHNAYFGAKMAYCGSIRREFAPRSKRVKR